MTTWPPARKLNCITSKWSSWAVQLAHVKSLMPLTGETSPAAIQRWRCSVHEIPSLSMSIALPKALPLPAIWLLLLPTRRLSSAVCPCLKALASICPQCGFGGISVTSTITRAVLAVVMMLPSSSSSAGYVPSKCCPFTADCSEQLHVMCTLQRNSKHSN